MRRSIIPVVVMALLVWPAVPSLADSRVDFSGRWYGFDPAPPDGDGSFMTLRIVPRDSGYTVTLVDTLATGACSPAAQVTLRGFGEPRGPNLLFTFNRVRCADGAEPQIGGGRFAFTMQRDGTLVDSFGITWFRLG